MGPRGALQPDAGAPIPIRLYPPPASSKANKPPRPLLFFLCFWAGLRSPSLPFFGGTRKGGPHSLIHTPRAAQPRVWKLRRALKGLGHICHQISSTRPGPFSTNEQHQSWLRPTRPIIGHAHQQAQQPHPNPMPQITPGIMQSRRGRLDATQTWRDKSGVHIPVAGIPESDRCG